MEKIDVRKGDKYQLLTIIEEVAPTNWKRVRRCFMCKCKCGKSKAVYLVDLRTGAVKSCGCLQTKHNQTKNKRQSPTYKSWASMCSRCRNPLSNRYERYGGRGITVCKRWKGEHGFENFFSDMGERPKGKTLDRINNDKGYTPKNCKWSTRFEQMSNTRCTKKVAYNGVLFPSVASLAHACGLSRSVVWSRLRNGWSIADAVETPLYGKRS